VCSNEAASLVFFKSYISICHLGDGSALCHLSVRRSFFFFFTLQLTIFYWSRGENPSTKVEKDTTRNCKQASIDFGLQLAALL